MRNTVRVTCVLGLVAWTLASCSSLGKTKPDQAAIAWGPKQTIAKAKKDYSPPAVRMDDSGRVDVAWIEKEKDGEKAAVQFLSLAAPDQTEQQPVTVNPPDSAPEATHAPVGLATGPGGELYLTWSVPKHIPNNDFATDIVLARSLNGGKSFEPPVVINDDGGTASRGFENLTVDRDGAIYLGWLDGRDKDKTRAAAYFARSTNQGKTVEKNLKIDGMACPCCRVMMTTAPDGGVFAGWRKTFDNDIRDVVVADSKDKGQTFSPPNVVKKDGWSFPACPHRGPSIAFDKLGRLYMAWYTEGNDGQPRVLFATSDDKGKTFSKAVSLHTSAISLPDQPRMVVHPDGIVLVVWEEMTGVRKGVVMRASMDRGANFSPVQALSEGAKEFNPAISINEAGRFAVSWNATSFPNSMIMLQTGTVPVSKPKMANR
jgi:hypothetical protein